MTVSRETPDRGPTDGAGVGASTNGRRWLTKAAAAAIVGVDERTIERAARAGRLGVQARPGFPTLYNPTDVEREAAARRTGVRGVILPDDPTPTLNGSGAIAHQRSDAPPVEALLVQVLQRLLGVIPAATTGPTGTTHGPTPGPTMPPPDRLFLTLAEAATVAGLPQADLRRLIDAGDLAVRTTGRGGIRIRRRDLEAL